MHSDNVKTTTTFIFWVAVDQIGIYYQVEAFNITAKDEAEAEQKLNEHFKDKKFYLMKAVSHTVTETKVLQENGYDYDKKVRVNHNALPHIPRHYQDVTEAIEAKGGLENGHYLFADKAKFNNQI